MSLMDTLKTLGGKLGLIQVAQAVRLEEAPTKLLSKSVTLGELAAQVKTEEIKALAELPAELSVPFAKVIETAGIKPPVHGWSVERLEELLKTEQYSKMDRAGAQQAILGVLAAVKAPVEDVVKDAIARDQALDSFEKFAKGKMDDRRTARMRKIAELEDKVKEFQKERAKLEDEGRTDEDHWKEWRRRKVACEKEMARAIGYLLEKPVVSIDPEDSKSP